MACCAGENEFNQQLLPKPVTFIFIIIVYVYVYIYYSFL